MLSKVFSSLFKKPAAQSITDAGNSGNINQAGRDLLVINPIPGKVKKTFTIDELFLRKKGSEISARDILLFRAGHNANFNENFYLGRKDVDGTLSRNVFHKRHSLIIGKPLSGKSRAIYELIKRDLQEYQVYIPGDFSCADDADIDITFDIQQDRIYFIICDLHDFLKKAAGISILKKILLQENAVIISDCRGERFDFVSDNMAELLELFTIINIRGISKEIRQMLKFSLKEHFREGDDTIGSYFLDTTSMRRFYEKELSCEEKEILRSYKALHLLWGQKLIARKEIIDYTQRRFEKHYNKTDKDLPPSLWHDWFQTLVKYGFIRIEGQFLLSEETYLENIIASEEKVSAFQDEVISFYPNIHTFNQLLHNAEVFFEVNKILDKLYTSGIRLEMSTYAILLSKCESFVEAEEIFDRMQQQGIRPDLFTYNMLLSKCELYADAKELFDRMQTAGIPPNYFTCQTLLLKCGSFGQVQTVILTMKEQGLRPGIKEYTCLLSKCRSYGAAEEVFAEIITQGLDPDLFVYNTLLSKCPDHRHAADVLAVMKEKDIPADLIIYNTMLTKCCTYAEGMEVIVALKREEIEPDFITYDRLLSVCEKYDQLTWVLEEMRLHAITPDTRMYWKAIAVCTTYTEAKVIFDHMEQEGLTPDYRMYNALLSKNLVFTEPLAEEFLSKIKQHGLSPTIGIYQKLISGCKTFDEATKIFEEIKKIKQPSRTCYDFLLARCEHYADIIKVRHVLETDGHALDRKFYNKALSKCTSYQQAEALLNEILGKGIEIENAEINRVLYIKGISYDSLKAAGERIKAHGIQLPAGYYKKLGEKGSLHQTTYHERKVYNLLFRRTDSLSEWLGLLKKMREDGLPPGKRTYSLLFSRTCSLSERRALLEDMLAGGLLPAYCTFSCIIRAGHTYEEAYDLFRTAVDNGAVPTPGTYVELMARCARFEDVEMLSIGYLKIKRRPSAAFYFRFLETCKTLTQVHKVLAIVKDRGLPEQRSFHPALLSVGAFDEALQLFEEMKKAGTVITRRTYHILLLHCRTPENIQALFTVMQQEGYSPLFQVP